MQIRTVSLTVSASQDAVFNFLADIENLPKWATEFCERIDLHRGGWLAYTSQGEMIVESETEDCTGVIDFKIGPSVDDLALFPVRVVALSGKKTLVSFAFIQPPSLPDEHYEKQYQSLLIEVRGLIRRFGGGELYAPDAMSHLSELGLN